jgi:hypothetical protein
MTDTERMERVAETTSILCPCRICGRVMKIFTVHYPWGDSITTDNAHEYCLAECTLENAAKVRSEFDSVYAASMKWPYSELHHNGARRLLNKWQRMIAEIYRIPAIREIDQELSSLKSKQA